jgi:hypothetical protein
MSASHLRRWSAQDGMSALPLKADIIGLGRDVRFGPLTDLAQPLVGWRGALRTSGFLSLSVVQYPVRWIPSHGARAVRSG